MVFKLLVPDEILKTIGQIIVEWTHFDTNFAAQLHILANEPPAQAAGITPNYQKNMHFRQRLSMWADAFVACGADPQVIEPLKGTIARLKNEREWVAHGEFLEDDEGNTVQLLKRGMDDRGKRTIKPERLDTALLDILEMKQKSTQIFLEFITARYLPPPQESS